MKNIIKIFLVLYFSIAMFNLLSQDLANTFKYKITHYKNYSILKMRIKNKSGFELQASPLLHIRTREPLSGWGCDSIDMSRFRICYNYQKYNIAYSLPDSMMVIKKRTTVNGIIKYNFDKNYYYVQRIFNPITKSGVKIIIELDKTVGVKKKDKKNNKEKVKIILINSFYD